MPTYEYVCLSCGTHVEVYQRFSDEPLTECGVCGGMLRKVFHPAGILFKGSGFYATDSRGSRGAKGPAGDSGSKADSESRSAGASSKGDSKTEGGSRPSAGSGSSSKAEGGSGTSSKERSA